jgi:hypothetical protein
MEVYFWSFVAALIVLLLGGVAALYRGVRHVVASHPIAAPMVNLVVLAVSAVFEASTSRSATGNPSAWSADARCRFRPSSTPRRTPAY